MKTPHGVWLLSRNEKNSLDYKTNWNAVVAAAAAVASGKRQAAKWTDGKSRLSREQREQSGHKWTDIDEWTKCKATRTQTFELLNEGCFTRVNMRRCVIECQKRIIFRTTVANCLSWFSTCRRIDWLVALFAHCSHCIGGKSSKTGNAKQSRFWI